MCGIAGFFDACQDLSPRVRGYRGKMVTALAHRGPDGRGEFDAAAVALGHSRLSIIDLQTGAQPLTNEDGSVVVVANGEIYNHLELRNELAARGHRFRTDSDCEVLVHLWEEYGSACVEKLRGMFAFVLYDCQQRVLFAARDRFGQKPLFYHFEHSRLTFASEIKALLKCPWVARQVDLLALDQFLFYQFVPPPRTMLEGVQQLPPAHWMRVEHGRLQIERYWSLSDGTTGEGADDDDLDRFEQAIDDAVASHLVSDVPVGIFLSGGIDSSIVAVLAARHSSDTLESFSIAFPGTRYDETAQARLASRSAGTNHHVFEFQPHDVPEQIAAAARAFDQPVADRAILPLMALSREASRFVKVVLTGDGGDEINAGYEKYRRVADSRTWHRWLARRMPGLLDTRELARCCPDPLGYRRLRTRLALKLSPQESGRYFTGFWEGWQRHKLFAPDVRKAVVDRSPALPLQAGLEEAAAGRDPNALDELALWDQTGYLAGDLLLKTDYSTMSFGLEARAPLLDHHLATVANRLPDRLKATAAQTKVALRQIAARLLPKELVERPKRGFGVPMKRWLQNELSGWTREILLDSSATTGEFFQRRTIERTIDEHLLGRHNHTGRLYTLLVFELWFRHHILETDTGVRDTTPEDRFGESVAA